MLDGLLSYGFGVELAAGELRVERVSYDSLLHDVEGFAAVGPRLDYRDERLLHGSS
jgi:hypothetical protein